METRNLLEDDLHKIPEPSPKPKNIFDRINDSNRSLGIFFGCLGGMTIAIILLFTQRLSIAIIGEPTTTIWKIFAVILAMGTGGNLCSYVGSMLDIITNERTIFDGIIYVLNCCKS
jgi:hypothetical protein